MKKPCLKVQLVECHDVPQPVSWLIQIEIGSYPFHQAGNHNHNTYGITSQNLSEILYFDGFRIDLNEQAYKPRQWVGGGLKLHVWTIDPSSRPNQLAWKVWTWHQWVARGHRLWLATGRNLYLPREAQALPLPQRPSPTR